MAKSKVTFPDGTEVVFPADAPPEQIRAILLSLKQSGVEQQKPPSNESSTGRVIEPKLTPEELWEQGSKKERLAIFVRNHFGRNEWFTVKQVLDEQIKMVNRIVFGESPALATYLNRLHDDKYLFKRKGRRVSYQLTDKVLEEYPPLMLDKVAHLLRIDL